MALRVAQLFLEKYLALFCFALIVASTALSDDKPDSLKTRYEHVYDELINLAPDSQNVVPINNVVLDRDVAHFILADGTLFFCKPVENRVCAAVFIGHGTFDFEPPTPVEQDQLYRFLEHRSLHEKIDKIFFLFSDSIAQQFRSVQSGQNAEIPRDANRYVENALAYFGEKDGMEFDADYIRPFIEHDSNAMFYAQLEPVDADGPQFFSVDPYNREEVRFMRRADIPRHFRTEIVNQFPRKGNFPQNTAAFDDDLTKAKQYGISMTFKDNLDAIGNALVRFSSVADSQHTVLLNLYPGLKIDSVFWEDGRKARWFQGDENYDVWIDAPTPLRKNDEHSLRFFYHGKILSQNEDLQWISIKSPDYWYPRDPGADKAEFTMTLQAPRRLTVVGCGENVSTREEGENVISEWKTWAPVRSVSFNVGLFKKSVITGDSTPAVTVYMEDAGHREIARQYAPEGILSYGSDMEERVGNDLRNSLLLYQKLLGPAPAKHFIASEIPEAHGQAFPGMIHLSWSTFQNSERDGSDAQFRAHEVAHQWWGIGMGFDSYHDQWLSEAFADFYGLMYMQVALKDNRKYFDMLKNWKDRILNNRKFLFSSGQESGPISLGYRTQSTKTAGDYDLIIYKKGAWVLHMLRNMLIDQKSMNEDLFKNIMREFYTMYAGKNPGTVDFERVVEKSMNTDMSWFFREWLDGTHIPHYKVAYKIVPQLGDKYRVSCRIDDTEAPSDFKMVVPLKIDFDANTFVRLRVMVVGPHAEFDLPLIPMKPQKINFNDLNSVLCEVDEVGWE